jgi:hypothetical protein
MEVKSDEINDLNLKRSNEDSKKSDDYFGLSNEILKVMKHCQQNDTCFNLTLFDSNEISTQSIFKQLETVDPQSSRTIHPNDRRKLCRLVFKLYLIFIV